MPKHNYKKRFMVSLVNKKKQMKNSGETKVITDIKLLEIPALVVYPQNNNVNASKKKLILNGNYAEQLVKEIPAVNFTRHKKLHLVDATADTIVDMPFTETYQGDFDRNRREERGLNLPQGDSNAE